MMTQILKRLEIIKSAIAIQENEIIDMQATKIRTLGADENVAWILDTLEGNMYSDASIMIDAYLAKYSGVRVYVDQELSALKLELKALENELQELIEQKSEYLEEIEKFNTMYNLLLGEIIKSILKLKKEIYYKKTIQYQKLKTKYDEDLQTIDDTEETITEIRNTIDELQQALDTIDENHEDYNELLSAYDELQAELKKLEEDFAAQQSEFGKIKQLLDDDESFKEYEEAKTYYDEFDNAYEHIKQVQQETIELNDDEKAELKKLYRKAARLCHPDIVPDELKQQATEIMQKLNAAYQKQDLVQVKSILDSLENGSGFEVSSDSINDKELIKRKIAEYKENIAHIKSEIEEIFHDDTYQTIDELDDWDVYFDELKNDLEIEKEKLEEEAKEVLEEKDAAPEWMQTLWHWADINNVPNGKISKDKERLIATTVLDLMGIKLNYLPDEIVNLTNLYELSLWDCGLQYLPKNIVEIQSLKKLNLRTNPALMLIKKQEQWLDELKNSNCIVYKDTTLSIDDIAFEEIKQNREKILDSSSYSYDELSKIISEWIFGKFSNIHKLDLSKEYRASIRIQDMAKKVARDLQSSGVSKIELRYLANDVDFVVENVSYATFGIGNIAGTKQFDEKPVEIKSFTPPTKAKKVIAESSSYASHIKSIEVANFEKIRRYCNNLLDENKADEMQKYLAENGKMHKALIYDALEQFIGQLKGKEITLVDWGCGQGIASMLVLDYIREKQLNIQLDKIFLMASSDTKDALDRAFAHIDVLKQNITKVYGTTVAPCPEEWSDETLENYNESVNFELNLCVNDVILHLFANDDIPFDFQAYVCFDFSFDIFNGYFLCISNDYEFDIDYIPRQIGSIEMLSVRDDKIGRFKRYERIFKSDRIEEDLLSKNHTSVIDLDEIPF
jgi:hypothetical protein